MSGDANTALGNCLLMCIFVRAAMRSLGVDKWDILDDGDDCLLFIPKSEEGKLKPLTKLFLSYGQELKLENRAEVMEKIVFCQHQPVIVDGEWRMVQDWKKVLSTRAGGSSLWTNPVLFRGMLHAVGLCELSLSRGVPILQEFASALIRMGDGTIPKAFACEFENWRRAVATGEISLRTTPVSLLTRESFADAFGVSVVDQLEIESRLRSWELSGIAHGQQEFLTNWDQDSSPREVGCE
jgi:hypothetical protein